MSRAVLGIRKSAGSAHVEATDLFSIIFKNCLIDRIHDLKMEILKLKLISKGDGLTKEEVEKFIYQ